MRLTKSKQLKRLKASDLHFFSGTTRASSSAEVTSGGLWSCWGFPILDTVLQSRVHTVSLHQLANLFEVLKWTNAQAQDATEETRKVYRRNPPLYRPDSRKLPWKPLSLRQTCCHVPVRASCTGAYGEVRVKFPSFTRLFKDTRGDRCSSEIRAETQSERGRGRYVRQRISQDVL